MDCSLPGSSIHRIFQAGILEWVTISFSGDLPEPGIEPASPALASGFFTTELSGKPIALHSSVQLLSHVLTLCDSMDCSMPGFPVHHQLPESTQTHVHWVSDSIEPFYPLSSPSPPAFNLSQHQGLFQSVSSSHQVAKVLEFLLQHQSFQWIFRTDFL